MLTSLTNAVSKQDAEGELVNAGTCGSGICVAPGVARISGGMEGDGVKEIGISCGERAVVTGTNGLAPQPWSRKMSVVSQARRLGLFSIIPFIREMIAHFPHGAIGSGCERHVLVAASLG